MKTVSDQTWYPKLQNAFFLIEQFAITDFKMRYSRSFLGYIWSLMTPLMFFAIYFFVFANIFKLNNNENYPIYLLSGIVLWNFFSETTQSGMKAISYKSSLITKVKFPKIIIPISSLFSNIFTLIINLSVFFIVLLSVGIKINSSFFFLIIIFTELMIMSFGISLLLSSFYLRFRDLEHAWGIFLQFGFWLSPIVYRINALPPKYAKLLLLNPMAKIIIDFQNIIIHQNLPSARSFLISLIVSLVIFCSGMLVFKKFQNKFSEWI